MVILSLRTDKPEAELGLFEGQVEICYISWEAHRVLAETIHNKINELLQSQNKQLNEVEGIVAYQGPGSFTGLRIGLSVANALSKALSVPIVAAGGDSWVADGAARLSSGENDYLGLPEYGAPVHITSPKK